MRFLSFVSLKAAARRAIRALEELDSWIRYYPSHSLDEFRQRSDDTAYVVNRNIAQIPQGTISTKLKKAADGYRALVLISAMTEGFAPSESMNKIEAQMADVLRKARQNTREAKYELSKR